MSWLSGAHSCIGCFALHRAGESHYNLFTACTAAWFLKQLANKPGRFKLATQRLVSVFGCYLGKLPLKAVYFPQSFGKEVNTLKGPHMAYPSASSLWMNDINTIVHPSGISEHDSGFVSPPLMAPNAGTQARGHETLRGVLFYPAYHLLNPPSPATRWRRNGSLQTVELGVNLSLNQKTNPQKDWIRYQKT